MRRLVVYGASGHGKVVADAAMAAGMEVLGFVDDDENKTGTSCLGLPVFGPSAWLVHHPEVLIALGIGDNHMRERVAQHARQIGRGLATVVHPAATVSRCASVGEGTVVFAGARINPDARVGAGVIVNTGAVIEHDCELGDFSHVSPNAALGGGARVGTRAHLGLGVSVRPLVRIGDDAVVGVGAAVVRDVPPGVVAVGVPAIARSKAS